MASEVFGYKRATVGKMHFRDDGTAMISGSGEIALIQSWTIQYAQATTPLYECGTSKVYFSSKHQAGTLTIDRVVMEEVSKMQGILGDTCRPKDVTVHPYKCKGSDKITTLRLKNNVLTGVTITGNSQQAHTGENLTCTFISLED